MLPLTVAIARSPLWGGRSRRCGVARPALIPSRSSTQQSTTINSPPPSPRQDCLLQPDSFPAGRPKRRDTIDQCRSLSCQNAWEGRDVGGPKNPGGKSPPVAVHGSQWASLVHGEKRISGGLMSDQLRELITREDREHGPAVDLLDQLDDRSRVVSRDRDLLDPVSVTEGCGP